MANARSWDLATAWCVARCASCKRCAHISISLKQRVCMWYSSCPIKDDAVDFRSGLVDAALKAEARSARSFASGTIGILSTHFVPWSQIHTTPSTLAANMRPTVEAAWRLRHTLSPTFPMELLVNRPEALRVLSRPEAGLWDGARVVRHHASLNRSHVVGQHFAKIHYAWRLSAFVQSSFQLTLHLDADVMVLDPSFADALFSTAPLVSDVAMPMDPNRGTSEQGQLWSIAGGWAVPPLCGCLMLYNKTEAVKQWLLSSAQRLLTVTDRHADLRLGDQEYLWYEWVEGRGRNLRLLVLPEEFYCPGNGATFEQSRQAFTWHTSWLSPTRVQKGAYPCRAVHTHDLNVSIMWSNQTGLTVPITIGDGAREPATAGAADDIDRHVAPPAVETPAVHRDARSQGRLRSSQGSGPPSTGNAVGTFKPTGDPRSKRKVGTQSEIPTITAADDNTRLIVEGYQTFDLLARKLDQPVVKHYVRKFAYIKSLLTRFWVEEGCRSMIDIGCSAGLISLIGRGVGFEQIHSLDHDAEYIDVVRRIASWAKFDDSILPREFSFGATLPATADVVFCGALIHWVFCRTANFQNSFDRIFDYLLAAVRPGKFLVIEWISDGTISNPKWWPERCVANDSRQSNSYAYTRAGFEAAALRHADLVEQVAPETKTRIFYVFRKHADRPTLRSTELPFAEPAGYLDQGVCNGSSSSSDVIHALGLRQLSVDQMLRPKLERKPTRSFLIDTPASMILKRANSRHAVEQLLSREVCILQLLQRFTWAPRLLCVGSDFMLTTYMGQPACAGQMNADLTQQLNILLNDMRSVGVRHNDLYRRHYQGRDTGTIEVMLRSQRISLVDFALGTINGSHAVSCTVNDKIYAVPAETMVHTSGVEQGRQMLERAAEVIHEMQNCSFRIDF